MTKASSVVASVTQNNNLGKEFHSLGPSTENALMPHEFRRYDGTTSCWPAAKRRWRLCAISETEMVRRGYRFSEFSYAKPSDFRRNSRPTRTDEEV